MIHNNKLNVINETCNTTCFSEHEKFQVSCNRTGCRNWVQMNDSFNCSIIRAKRGPMSMTEISNYFNVDRKQICKIFKSAKTKLLLALDN